MNTSSYYYYYFYFYYFYFFKLQLHAGLDENPLLTDEEHALYPWYSGCPNTSSLFVFTLLLRMPSAFSPALSRVASPNRTHVLLLELGVEVAKGGKWGGGSWV